MQPWLGYQFSIFLMRFPKEGAKSVLIRVMKEAQPLAHRDERAPARAYRWATPPRWFPMFLVPETILRVPPYLSYPPS
jgi:hypothetical protein